MYEIDMIKGEGIPIRSRPRGIAFACLVIIVPLLAGLVAASIYCDGEVAISIRQQQLERLEGGIAKLSEALQKKEALEKEQTQIISLLSNVQKGLASHTQWSPILEALVTSTPDVLTLLRLETRMETLQRKVAAKDDPARKIEIGVPARALKIGVGSHDKRGSYDVVRGLREDLQSSPVVGPLLDAVTVSQNAGMLDGQDAVQYELNCTFKPLGVEKL